MLRRTFPVAVAVCAITGTAQAQEVARVVLQPPSLQVEVGAKEPVVAQAMAANNNVIPTASFTWSSSNTSVARVTDFDPMVSSLATIDAVGPGIATIEVRSGSQVGRLTVQVSGAGAAPPPSPPVQPQVRPGARTNAEVLQAEPEQLMLLQTESAVLQPRFIRSDGTAGIPERVTWVSQQSSVANVDSLTGEVTGFSPGVSVVIGTSASGLQVRVPVSVSGDQIAFDQPALGLAPGSVDTLNVIVPNQNSRRIAPQNLRWRSQNTSVVRVSPLGIVSGVAEGSTEIVASGFFQEIRIPVSVHPRVTDLLISPRASTPVYLPLNGTREFSVEARSANDTPVPEAVLTWSVRDSTILSFDRGTGVARGKALGVDTIRVRAPGGRLEVAWEVRVIAGGLLLGTQRAGLAVGDRLLVPAQFTDDLGNPISEASGVSWSSSDPSVVTVSNDGNLTGIAVGSAQVFASTAWGTADTIDVFVGAELYVSSNREGSWDLYGLNRNQLGAFYRITDFPDAEANAAISPDRTRMAFVSNALGSNDIYVANIDGSNPVPVTDSPAQEGAPAWTPDGSRIVYHSNEGGVPQVWIMEADGSNKLQLTRGPTANTDPVVSADGQLAFASLRDGNYEIYSANLDGSNPVNLTRSPQNEKNPFWLSDGAIAFTREVRSSTGPRLDQQRLDFTVMVLRGGGIGAISPPGYAVTDFAISRSDDLLAMIVTEFTDTGTQRSKLFLHEIGSNSQPIEVRPTVAGESYLGVAFRP